MVKLKVEKREVKQPVRSTQIRGVVYGKELEENVLVSVDYNTFEKTYNEFGGSSILTLEVEGEEHDVLIKAIQVDPRKDIISHVDFYAVVKGQVIDVEVPFEFIGESNAVKQGSVLNTAMHEITVKTLPRNIPSSLEVDLSKLENEGDAIRLEDISLPEGVEFATENLEETIVSAIPAVEAADEIDDEEVEFAEEKEGEEGEENKDSGGEESKTEEKK
ncbi:MAG: 50S ribosomal protein L25 [Candidatus Pacebacteria bacterium]|nr:50S ribosomal protein L25 [Candidatus Paceibacterota bacterium]